MRIGITGGIGSGKSFVCKLLEASGIAVYDCDTAAKRLMCSSPTLRSQLTALIGPETYLSSDTVADGYRLNKPVVAKFLMQSQENAEAIDAIVHPAVFADFLASSLQWVESAILYESGLYKLVDRVVVVTAPEELRIARVMRRDGISRTKALQWLGKQWPQERLRQMADFEIVNDGKCPLQPQINDILQQLSSL